MNWHSMLSLVPITVVAVAAFVEQMRERRRERSTLVAMTAAWSHVPPFVVTRCTGAS